MTESLSWASDEEILDGKGGPSVDPEVYELIECWTLTTQTNTTPMFKLYRSDMSWADYEYILHLRDGGATLQTKFLGFDEDELDAIVESMQNNPLITVHRSPGKLLGEKSDGIVTTK